MQPMKTCIAAALAAAIVATPQLARAASDNVLSGNIKEADGTTGQDTNNGSGVKTGHIQDGAVTPAKIGGPIPAAKIDRAGLDADSVDGYQAADFRRRSSRVIVVANDATGDFSDPAQALASISDASEANAYLVKVMPGTYPVAVPLVMKAFVHLEGSGQGATQIVLPSGTESYFRIVPNSEVRSLSVRAVDASAAMLCEGLFADGTVRVTDVTLRNTITGSVPTVISAWGGGFGDCDALLTRVTVVVDTAPGLTTTQTGGVAGNRMRLRDCDISVVGAVTAQAVGGYYPDIAASRLAATASSADYRFVAYGVVNYIDARIRNSRITVSGPQTFGVYSEHNDAEVANSEVTATGTAIRAGAGTTRVAHSKVVGALVNAGGTLTCIGVYDAMYTSITCP